MSRQRIAEGDAIHAGIIIGAGKRALPRARSFATGDETGVSLCERYNGILDTT